MLERRKAQHLFGEISDEIRTKRFIPLGSNIWNFYKMHGWDALDNTFQIFTDIIYELGNVRLNESIYTIKAVQEEEIKQPEKTLCYAASPPVLTVRTDLQTGLVIMLYGQSVDVPFVVIDDTTQNVLFVLNAHLEDGIPVDWWLVPRDDELLERRHQKYGYKLREMVKRCRGLTDSGSKFVDVFRDIRNERTPQWNNSTFSLGLIWVSGVLNLLLESSNYEAIGTLFDGLAAKLFYGMGDYWFALHPFPPMMSTFMYLGRPSYIQRFTGLSTGKNLYLQPIEEAGWSIVRENLPATFEYIKEKYQTEGIVTPLQSLQCEIPKFKNKKIWKDESNLTRRFPPGDRIHAEDLALTVEDCIKGVYLDFTHEETGKVTPDRIISIGCGRNTKFYNLQS